MTVSKRVGWWLVAFGVWSWIIWPTFLRNIWRDSRSWHPDPHSGPTAFFVVHAVLTVASLTFGTAIAALGLRIVRPIRRRTQSPQRSSVSPERGYDAPIRH